MIARMPLVGVFVAAIFVAVPSNTDADNKSRRTKVSDDPALRRVNDVEVAVEVIVLNVSEETMEKQEIDFRAEAAQPKTDVLQKKGAKSAPAPQAVAYVNARQARDLLAAVQGDRQSTILQAPKMTIADGELAHLKVGAEQFFITDIDIVKNGAEIIFRPKNEAHFLGWKYSVQPVVSDDLRTVRLSLALTHTAVDGPVPLHPVQIAVDKDGNREAVPFRMFIQQPKLSGFSVERTVKLESGHTAVLHCGLMLEETRVEFGPPILSQIPYLSRLFRNVGYVRTARSVLVLVTPRVIVNEATDQGR